MTNLTLPSSAATGRSLPLAAALAALAFAPFVDGAVVLSNFSGFGASPSTFALSGSGGTREAIRVSTGPGSWNLNSVSIITGYLSTGTNFQIWSNSTNTLGTLLHTSNTVGNFPWSAGTQTFTFSTPVVLSGNTDYWLTATPVSGFWDPRWAYNSTATFSSTFGWSQVGQLSSTDSGTTWGTSSNRSFASLEIDATAASSGVPDGTSTAFMLLPGAGLLALRFRRRTAGA
jgi:hypothetical protein